MLLALEVSAQEKESFYVFDADWKPTKIESAHFLLHTHQVNDTCWQWDYYNFSGPLIQTERFRENEGKVRNGVCNHYNEKGVLDSTSMYRNGKRNGDFMKLTGDGLTIKMKYVYRDDSLMEVIDVSNQKKDTSVTYADERESEYPGKTGQWLRYLNKNLQYPDRAFKGNFEGEVRVAFIVDKDGKVFDPYIARSVEYSLDEESLRMVRQSGKWVPAFQNGKFVKSYKIQPIRYRLK
jgi:protein TonB